MSDPAAHGAADSNPHRPRGGRWRYRLELALLRAAVWLVPKLPLPLVHGTASMLGTLGWMVDRRGRTNGMENLRCAFGEALTVKKRRRILRGSYRVFARTFMELFWAQRLTEQNYGRFFTFTCDTQGAREALDSNHAVFVSCHIGGFEASSIAKALHRRASMTIAQDFKNPPFTAIFGRLRTAGGRHQIIPQEGAMLRLFKHIKKGGSAQALVDFSMHPDRGATVIRMFGRPASVSFFHCALAQRAGVPLVPVIGIPDGRRWTVRICDPIPIAEGDDPAVAAQQCWDIMETYIRERPEQWLWMYKHWRYRPADALPQDWPVYAKPDASFDRLLRESDTAAARQESSRPDAAPPC